MATGSTAPTGSRAGQLLLKPLVRDLELAGELRVEIAPRVNLRDQRGSRRQRAIRRRLRLHRLGLPRLQRAQLLLEHRAFLFQRVEGPLVVGDALLVDVHQRGHGARRPAEFAYAG